MTILQIIFSTDFLLALGIYSFMVILTLRYLGNVHENLAHSVLQWPWVNIGLPLLRSALMLIFILIAYPTLFGIADAPPLAALFDANTTRVNYLVNILFLTTLLFPLIPVIGKWEELILPVQAIAASSMLFSWTAAEAGISVVQYWPGFLTILYILVWAFITHWLTRAGSHYLGEAIDSKYNVEYSGELLSRSILLILQSPAIVIFSAALGRQLN